MARRPDYQRDGVTLYLGDCMEILPEISSVDAVVTDPPYGIDYNPTRSQKSAASGSRKTASKVIGDNRPFDPSPLLSIATKQVLWGANNYCHKLPPSHGWLIWDKREGGALFRGFVASDAEMAWSNVTGRVQTFSHRWCGHLRDSERDSYLHPTQKPVALMIWCLGLVGEGLIADPFMGSGTTGVACIRTGQPFIGIEMDPTHFATAVKRIDQALDADRDSLWSAKELAKETQQPLFE